MLIPSETIKKILDIIKNRHNLFVIKNIGKEVLSDDEIKELKDEYGDTALQQINDFIKDSYGIGTLRGDKLNNNEDPKGINLTTARTTDLGKFTTPLSAYSIEHAKEITDSYVSKLSSSVQTSFEQLMREYDKMYRDKIMTEVAVPMKILATEQKKTVGELATAMRDVTGDYARDFQRIAETETMNAINFGSADRIVKLNEGKSPKDIIVFKRIINDSSVCQHCVRLHLSEDGVTPKIYTLQQALANGSNVGRKAKDWLFTIPVVHPHCRCTLSSIPQGFWFAEEGNLKFVGDKNHKESVDQNLTVK